MPEIAWPQEMTASEQHIARAFEQEIRRLSRTDEKAAARWLDKMQAQRLIDMTIVQRGIADTLYVRILDAERVARYLGIVLP